MLQLYEYILKNECHLYLCMYIHLLSVNFFFFFKLDFLGCFIQNHSQELKKNPSSSITSKFTL